MAELGEFLGALVSSISNARVLSDIQTISIAKEYAKDNLLQHLAVPRMRVQDVEITIPIAIENLNVKRQIIYEPIDNKRFASISYQIVVRSLGLKELPLEVSKVFRTEIAVQINALESRLLEKNAPNPLSDYTKQVSSLVVNNLDLLKKNRIKFENQDDLKTLPDRTNEELTKALSGEIRIQSQNTQLSNLEVVVEAQKLREMKPEYLVVIKMKISEEGVVRHTIEDKNGGTVERLLPE